MRDNIQMKGYDWNPECVRELVRYRATAQDTVFDRATGGPISALDLLHIGSTEWGAEGLDVVPSVDVVATDDVFGGDTRVVGEAFQPLVPSDIEMEPSGGDPLERIHERADIPVNVVEPGNRRVILR